jgi:hypothetical protein
MSTISPVTTRQNIATTSQIIDENDEDEDTTRIEMNDESKQPSSPSSASASSKQQQIDRNSAVGLFWLFIWFLLNVVLALLNKYIFKATPFNFPVLLSFAHMAVGAVLAYVAAWSGLYQSETSKLTPQARNSIRIFVILFCLNIAVGNISVQIVNLAASQVVRSTTPLFMIVVAYQIQNTTPSLTTVIAVIPIVMGVALTVVGDVDLNFISLTVLFLGNLLAALKVVLANKYINQFKLHPIDLLKELSPLASVVMFAFALCMGEVSQFFKQRAETGFTYQTYAMVLFTAICAFALNWTNMMANKFTSPLTMSVTANVKQIVLVVLSIFFFKVPVNIYNGSGISIALLGMCYYSYIKYQESQSKNSSAKQ